MKTNAWIIALTALAIVSCNSQKKATTYVDDDVYLSSSPPAKVVVAPAPHPAAQGEQIVVSPDEAKAQKPASSTLEEDYNDYSYADRINRFNNKDTTVGYFEQSSSGSSGSYGNNGPDVNLYFGAGYGYGGYYGPSYSFGMGWGYPYWGWDYGWGYPYWGYPYYGYPYYGYYPWYDPCFYCCGYYDYYPYYSTGTYYGSRTTLARSSGGGSAPTVRSASDISSDAMNRSTGQSVTSTRTALDGTSRNVQPSQEKYRYTRPSGERTAINQRTSAQATPRSQDKINRQQPAPKYVRPETVSPAKRSGSAQSYSSPVYRQPKSSQEYLAPRSQNSGTGRSGNVNVSPRAGSSGSVTRQGASPAYERISTPVRSGSREYSAPKSSSPSYSTPSRSGSSGSYSAPARSGSSGSYSAPSRSSGSSGSSPSSGSSGGGGRRR